LGKWGGGKRLLEGKVETGVHHWTGGGGKWLLFNTILLFFEERFKGMKKMRLTTGLAHLRIFVIKTRKRGGSSVLKKITGFIQGGGNQEALSQFIWEEGAVWRTEKRGG